jgi:methylamine utilization protein MauE
MKTKHWITELIIFLLAALFFYTAVDKLMDYHQFIWQINNQPFANSITPWLAPALPAIELTLTLLLLWHRTSLIGLYSSAALLSIFTIYIALVTFNFYDHMPCACATAFEQLSWPLHLVINAGFLLIATIGIYLLRKHKRE